MGVLNRHLPKWPMMYVRGEPITKEQAAEVILRCSGGLEFGTNDYHFLADVYRAMGLRVEDATFNGCHEARHGTSTSYPPGWVDNLEELQKELKVIEGIEYLQLGSRVMSAFIQGPHGWLHWDGNVFTNSYNIGKWPSVEGVRGEWRAIAKAFPFLNLNCVLMSGETCEDHIEPVVEYQIKDGRVRTIEPKTKVVINQMSDADLMAHVEAIRSNWHRERGVTLEQFKWALEIARLRVADNASLEKR